MKKQFFKSVSISKWITASLITGILTTSCSVDDIIKGIEDNPSEVIEMMEEPEPVSLQNAFITDTSGADTGELRLDLDETLLVGMMSVTISKEITQDGFINLSGSSTSRSNAMIDMRIDDLNGYEFTESGDSINAIANFPTFLNDELVDVVIAWDATNATDTVGPLMLITIDGQIVTDAAFSSESRNLAAVMEGVRTIQFRLGGNSSLDESGAGMLVDNLKVYDMSTGTSVIVFEDDFESYVVGDSLDPNAATASAGPVVGAISVINSPYRNNSFQVTVQGEGEIVDPIIPGSDTDLLRTSPFGFSDAFEGDDFQVDNDSEGAHNWSAREYDIAPIDNGFDVRDYIFVTDNRLILQCPSSINNDITTRRRAEYRDQTDINLNDAHSMDFIYDIQNYDNSSELIMAQLHNDNIDARRPYVTILAEDGIIRIQRTNAPTGSSSLRSDEVIPFRANNQYRITIESGLEDRSVYARIINLGTEEQAEITFDFAPDWNDLDGDFYWKFGAYMPDGGSTNTQMRMESIEITGE